MKKSSLIFSIIFLLISVSVVSFVFGRRYQQQAYVLEHEKDLGIEQVSPHSGTGMSTGYVFFKKATDLKFSFRKRVLKKGSAIGYHLQKEDEVYYVVSGTGTMKMNSDSFAVKTGDGILTRPGSSHGLQQTGNDELVLIITYPIK